MKYILLILFSVLISCTSHKEPAQQIKKEDPLTKIIWLHKDVAIGLSKEMSLPILMYIYDNDYLESRMQDFHTLSDIKVAQKINDNFLPIRVEPEFFEDQFSPGTTLILSSEGDILVEVVGYVSVDELFVALDMGQAIYKNWDNIKQEDNETQESEEEKRYY